MNEVNKAIEINEGYVEIKTTLTCLLLALARWGNRRGVNAKKHTSQFYPVFFSARWIIDNTQTQNLSCKQHNNIIKLKRRLLGWMLALPALTCAMSAYAATPSPVPTELPILSLGSAYAATDLVAKVSHSESEPGKATAKLSWSVTNKPGSQQRIDITMYWDGFERGNFESVAPLPPDQSAIELTKLEPGINYYWRVLRLTPEGWVPSETARCAVPAYPIDRPQRR